VVRDRCSEDVMTRIGLVVALSLGLALGASQPTFAKGGPIRAVIDGPGMTAPITVPRGDRLAELVDSSGLFTGLWRRACEDSGGCVHPPDHLGPWYTVTYTFSRHQVVQYVYPYATDVPIAYVPAGQRFSHSERTAGGWFMGGLPLRWSLVDLGVPLASPAVEPVLTTSVPPAASAPPLLLLVLVVVLVIVGGAIISRSRRHGDPRHRSTRVADHP
jgi:hypothetical protein